MLRKRSNKAFHSALVIEARAGLIPESDWIVEEVRARIRRTARIGRVIESRARSLSRGSRAVAISEVLADLRHYCDCKGLTFEELDTAASENYEDEASQSRMVRSPELRMLEKM
jgi:hypothetical protein